MTNEEAIDVLNNTAWLGTDVGIKVYPAVKMAVEALEKQIPKKPYVDEYGCYRCKCCRCAVEYEAKAKGGLLGTWRDNICSNCGHHVDWSEVEE